MSLSGYDVAFDLRVRAKPAPAKLPCRLARRLFAGCDGRHERIGR